MWIVVIATLVGIAWLATPLAARNLLSDTVVAREKEVALPAEYLTGVDGSMARGRTAIPNAIAWSPKTNQIAVTHLRTLLIDSDAGRFIQVESGLDLSGTAKTILSWSLTNPLLAVVKDTEASIIDTSSGKSRVVAKIRNVYPNVLDAYGASVVKGDRELLVIAGQGRGERTGSAADIAAYDLSTGEKKLSWKFPNDGTRYYISEAHPVISENNDVFVAAYVNHVIQKGNLNIKSVAEEDVWIINVSQAKIHCRLNIYDENTLRNSNGTPILAFSGLDFSSNGKWVVASSGQYTDIYDAHSCKRLKRVFDHPNISDVRSKTPSFGKPKFSKDSRWLLAYAPVVANIRLWRTSDWLKVYDSPFAEKNPSAADFNADGSRFAVATENKIVLYKINTK